MKSEKLSTLADFLGIRTLNFCRWLKNEHIMLYYIMLQFRYVINNIDFMKLNTYYVLRDTRETITSNKYGFFLLLIYLIY